MTTSAPRGPAGFEEFFRHWLPQVKRYLTWRETDRSLIDDAAQETMHSAYRYWATVSGYDNPRVWLFRVAGQRLSDERAKRRADSLTGQVGVLEVDRDDPIARIEALADIVPMIRKLPEHQIAPLVLHYYGFSDQEIGEVVGIAPTTARSSRSRALKTLRTLRGDQDSEAAR